MLVCSVLQHSSKSYSWRTCLDTRLRTRQFSCRSCKCSKDLTTLLELRLPNKLPQTTTSCEYLPHTMPAHHSSWMLDNLFSMLSSNQWVWPQTSSHIQINVQIIHLDHLESAFEGQKLFDKLYDDISRMMQLLATGHLRWEKAAFSYIARHQHRQND